jgi:sterol desaturase/sphingolipid hydroxylase (fatty acid hydroxylase superfamily)
VRRADLLRASPPLFESRWLDRLTRVRPIVPPLIFVPAILVTASLGFAHHNTTTAALGLLGGYALWTLSEYWIHRSLFHIEPKTPLGHRLHFIIHGIHHDHPNDPLRLVMPPIVTIPTAAAFLALFLLTLPTPLAWTTTAGYYSGYLAYDLTHYALHHTKPKNRAGRWLHQLHMRHHFEDHTKAFGVSAPWWDTIFRTSPQKKKP